MREDFLENPQSTREEDDEDEEFVFSLHFYLADLWTVRNGIKVDIKQTRETAFVNLSTFIYYYYYDYDVHIRQAPIRKYDLSLYNFKSRH